MWKTRTPLEMPNAADLPVRLRRSLPVGSVAAPEVVEHGALKGVGAVATPAAVAAQIVAQSASPVTVVRPAKFSAGPHVMPTSPFPSMQGTGPQVMSRRSYPLETAAAPTLEALSAKRHSLLWMPGAARLLEIAVAARFASRAWCLAPWPISTPGTQQPCCMQGLLAPPKSPWTAFIFCAGAGSSFGIVPLLAPVWALETGLS